MLSRAVKKVLKIECTRDAAALRTLSTFSSRRSNRLIDMFKSVLLINQATRRSLATTAAVSSIAPTSVSAGLILSRIPIVTPEMTEFEQKYYKYNEELEKRLMWTFPKYFYFKKGTIAERAFAEAQDYPIPAQEGIWFPKGKPELKHGRNRRERENITLPKQDPTKTDDDILAENTDRVRFQSRITEADKTNDTKSIERKLPRTLYLLVQQGKDWKFPSFQLESFEKSLNEVAEEGLRSIVGKNINTWTVSNSPTAVLKYQNQVLLDPYQESDNEITSREFLLKSHIVAGKFDFKPDSTFKGYQWLVKEEIEDLVSPEYFSQVGHLLSNV